MISHKILFGKGRSNWLLWFALLVSLVNGIVFDRWWGLIGMVGGIAAGLITAEILEYFWWKPRYEKLRKGKK